MKFLYSNFGGFSGNTVSQSSLEMAKFSNFLLQKYGFETIFVGDEKSIDFYKPVPYNQVLKLDDRINHIPETMWSAGKLIALSMMNEPVIHVDFDLFFLNQINIDKINKPIICLHTEKNLNHIWEGLYKKYISIAPQKTLNQEITSYNAALIGGTNINLIKSCANELIDYAINNKDKINQIGNFTKNLITGDADDNIAVLLEQIWLYQLFKYSNEKISTYLQGDVCVDGQTSLSELNINALNEGLVHFQGYKGNIETTYTISELCKTFNL